MLTAADTWAAHRTPAGARSPPPDHNLSAVGRRAKSHSLARVLVPVARLILAASGILAAAASPVVASPQAVALAPVAAPALAAAPIPLVLRALVPVVAAPAALSAVGAPAQPGLRSPQARLR